jgi:hypothetical protein
MDFDQSDDQHGGDDNDEAVAPAAEELQEQSTEELTEGDQPGEPAPVEEPAVEEVAPVEPAEEPAVEPEPAELEQSVPDAAETVEAAAAMEAPAEDPSHGRYHPPYANKQLEADAKRLGVAPA